MNIQTKFEQEKVIPVIRESTFELGLKRSLLAVEGGMKIIEVTFTTPQANKIIKTLNTNDKNLIVGAGTVLTAENALLAIEAGSKFIVSPAFDKEVSQVCKEKGVIYVPGAVTPTEVDTIHKDGWNFVKIFPSSTMGMGYIKTIKSLFPEVEIMATGGINMSNYLEWLSTPLIAIGIGSDLFKGTDMEVLERVRLIKDDQNK